jgi:hypothetical protein
VFFRVIKSVPETPDFFQHLDIRRILKASGSLGFDKMFD